MKLKDYFKKAKEKRFAIPHFNFASAEQLKAIVLGFQDIVGESSDYALMVGTSEGEANFLGYDKARALVDAWEEDSGLPIFLNADHHKKSDLTIKAINDGYDTVLFDASKMPFEENVKETKKIVDYAKKKEVEVEGELGYLRGTSEVQTKIEIKKEDFTKPKEAIDFVEKTGIDRLAIAIGNIHGLTTEQEMEIDIDLIKKIKEAVPETFLVLHGGSGLTDDDFRNAIKAGITNIHINTEVRVAYREGLEEELKEEPTEVAPYKFLAEAVEDMRKVVSDKVKVFLGL